MYPGLSLPSTLSFCQWLPLDPLVRRRLNWDPGRPSSQRPVPRNVAKPGEAEGWGRTHKPHALPIGNKVRSGLPILLRAYLTWALDHLALGCPASALLYLGSAVLVAPHCSALPGAGHARD